MTKRCELVFARLDALLVLNMIIDQVIPVMIFRVGNVHSERKGERCHDIWIFGYVVNLIRW